MALHSLAMPRTLPIPYLLGKRVILWFIWLDLISGFFGMKQLGSIFHLPKQYYLFVLPVEKGHICLKYIVQW